MDSRQYNHQSRSGNNNVCPGKIEIAETLLTPEQFVAALRTSIEKKQHIACFKLLRDMSGHCKKDRAYQAALAKFLAEKDAEKFSYFYLISQSSPAHIIKMIIELLDEAALHQLCLQYSIKCKLPVHALYDNEYLQPNSTNDVLNKSIYAAYEHATLKSSSMALDENPDYHTIIKCYPLKKSDPVKQFNDKFIQKIQLAWQALVSARRAIRHSTTHPYFNDTHHDIKNENFVRIATVREIQKSMDAEIRALELDSNIFIRFQQTSALFKSHASGNCHEYALLVTHELLKRGLSETIAMVELHHGDHVLTAFNFTEYPYKGATHAWDNVIFIDAWSGSIFTYKEHLEYLKDCVNYMNYDYQAYHISVPYEPTIHQLKPILTIDLATYSAQQSTSTKKDDMAQSLYSWETCRQTLMSKMLKTHLTFAQQYVRTQHNLTQTHANKDIDIQLDDDHFAVTATTDTHQHHERMTTHELIYASLHTQYATLLKSHKTLLIEYFNSDAINHHLFDNALMLDDIVLDRLAFKCTLKHKPSAAKTTKPTAFILAYANITKYIEAAYDDMYFRLTDKAFYYLMLHPDIYGEVVSYTFENNTMILELDDETNVTLSTDEVLHYATLCRDVNQSFFIRYFFDCYIDGAYNYFKYTASDIPTIECNDDNLWLSQPGEFPIAITIAQLKRYTFEAKVLTEDALLACYDVKAGSLDLHQKILNDYDIQVLVSILQNYSDITMIDLSHTNITHEQLAALLEIETLTTMYLMGVTLSPQSKALIASTTHMQIQTHTPVLSSPTALNAHSMFSPANTTVLNTQSTSSNATTFQLQ